GAAPQGGGRGSRAPGAGGAPGAEPETAPGGVAAPGRLSEQIALMRDEIELLQINLKLHRVNLEGAMVAHERARRVFELKVKAGIPVIEEEQLRAEVDSAKVQVAVREAELQTTEVKLRQAARRLATLEERRKAIDAPAGEGAGIGTAPKLGIWRESTPT